MTRNNMVHSKTLFNMIDFASKINANVLNVLFSVTYQETLCYFKICNKRSMENYRNYIPYTKKNFQQFY